MKNTIILLSLLSQFACADYVLTAKGGVGPDATIMGGGEFTYYGFLDYLEAGVFGEGHAKGGGFGGIVTRLYLPVFGLFLDAKIGNGFGLGAGIRLSLPIEVRPFISVNSTGRGADANLGVMLSIPL